MLILVLEAIFDQVVLAYSSMGLVMVLYVAVMVSFDLPQLVDVRLFSILSVFFAFSFEFSICLLKVSLVSRVSPRIFG